VTDNPRIEELRRRVDKDPASIAFAQLAEEYRRAGEFEEAVRVCESGLAQHPAYISARVTLGRALMELGRLDDAKTEFERVLESAPDNLTALGKLAEIQHTKEMADTRDRPSTPATASHEAHAHNPVLAELETWLEVIDERRQARRHPSAQ